MLLNLKKSDILIILALSLPKFVVGFITSMVIPIFPSLIQIHFNNSTNSTFNSTGNTSDYNYQQLSILFVAKNLCQIVISPIIGCLIDFLGLTTLLLLGGLVQIMTILVYGLGTAYYLLIIGRIFEALSSTSVNCAASAFVAYRFRDHKQRGFVFGVNGLCLCIGTAIGPAYGGVVFQYYGKTVVFLSVLSLIFVEILLAISIIIMEQTSKDKPGKETEIDPKKDYIKSMENLIPIPLTELLPTSTEVDDDDDEESVVMNGDSHDVPRLRDSLISAEEKLKSNKLSPEETPSNNVCMFFKDVYFLISIGAFPVLFMSLFLLFSSLPRYMSLEFGASESKQGVIWLVNILGYVFGFISGNIINTKLANYRHLILTGYTLLHAAGIVCIPFMPVWWSIAIPLCVIMHVHLVTEVVLAPILATIVETRHSSKFGTMSGIIMLTIAITASIGSYLGPELLKTIGFLYMNIAVAAINVLYAPSYLLLKRFCQST